jgi:hypothetical protein
MNHPTRLLVVVAALAALGGCATPRFLVGDTFHAGRSSKTILIPTAAADNNNALYNYVVRLCDIDAQGVEYNCKDTVILENVVTNSAY